MVQAGREPDGPHIFVDALNMGPVSNRFGLVFCRESWWQRRIEDTGGAFIYPDYAHGATTRGSVRIEVGDTATSVFPYDADCFLKEDFVQVGVSDGYGRMHWAPRAQLPLSVAERGHPGNVGLSPFVSIHRVSPPAAT